MDESDDDQILTIGELRALRDRMGAEAVAARQARSAAHAELPAPPTVVSREAPAELGEDLRHQPRHQLYLPRRRWPGRLAALACLAVAGGAVIVLMSNAHSRPDPRPAGEFARPVFPGPVASAPAASAPVGAAPVDAPSVDAMPTVTTLPTPAPSAPEPAVVPAPPIAAAPSGSAERTTRRSAAAVPAPRTTRAPAPPRAPAAPPDARPLPAGDRPPDEGRPSSTDGRPPPTVVNLDEPPQGSAPNRAGAPGAQGNGTPAPTSWSPDAPP